MRQAALLVCLLAAIPGARACQGSGDTSGITRSAFVGVNLASLSEHDRLIVTEAADDFQAVVAGKKPEHAVPETQTPPPSDGGTSFYRGHGYRLTIEKAFSEIGSTAVVAYGPILVFDEKFAPGNENKISDVRFYSHERLNELLSCGSSGHS